MQVTRHSHEYRLSIEFFVQENTTKIRTEHIELAVCRNRKNEAHRITIFRMPGELVGVEVVPRTQLITCVLNTILVALKESLVVEFIYEGHRRAC